MQSPDFLCILRPTLRLGSQLLRRNSKSMEKKKGELQPPLAVDARDCQKRHDDRLRNRGSLGSAMDPDELSRTPSISPT